MIYLIEFLIILIFIIILLRKGISLGIVMILSSVLLGVISLMPPVKFIKTSFFALIDKNTLLLIVFLVMVSFLEKILNQSGQLERMIGAMKKFVPGRRLRLIIMPAFLGFLASPGGAMFSAPFVEKASKNLNISPEQKTFINYWFRHLWEYFLPTYPGVVLAVVLLSVPYGSFFKIVFPYTLVAIAGGVIFGLLPLRLEKKKENLEEAGGGSILDLFFGIFPVAALLVLVIIFKQDMVLSLLAILIFMIIVYRISPENIFYMFKRSISYNVLLSVIGIFIFKDVLTASGLAEEVSRYFSTVGIPHVFLFFFMPLLVGFLTGVTQAFVGITFPVLIDMIGLDGNLKLFCFAFLCGILGVFLSPVHLCLALTSEYFNAKIIKVYKYLWPSVLLLLITSIVITFLL